MFFKHPSEINLAYFLSFRLNEELYNYPHTASLVCEAFSVPFCLRRASIKDHVSIRYEVGIEGDQFIEHIHLNRTSKIVMMSKTSNPYELFKDIIGHLGIYHCGFLPGEKLSPKASRLVLERLVQKEMIDNDPFDARICTDSLAKERFDRLKIKSLKIFTGEDNFYFIETKLFEYLVFDSQVYAEEHRRQFEDNFKESAEFIQEMIERNRLKILTSTV